MEKGKYVKRRTIKWNKIMVLSILKYDPVYVGPFVTT